MTATAEPKARFVRPDGKEKVTGAGRYTADLDLAGQAHARFRYADRTHARITRIDTTKARALPGVLAVVTHEDVPDVKYGGMVKDRLLFARDTVRFEGDIVACVAALSPAIAAEAAALIEVEYEPLAALTDQVAAAAAGAPLVHDDWQTDEREAALGSDANVVGRSTIVHGDAAAALAGADVVVRGRYTTDPVQGVPIEPRAIIAQWAGDRVTIWSSTQVPYAARSGVAHTLQIPESHVRIVVPLLGGGFGAKCDFHFEAHVAALARAARRPVKLVFSRREEFVAPGHRREGMVIELETGARRDGTLVARRARLVLDKGAYTRRGWVLRPDGGDDGRRPLRGRGGRRRVAARLHEQPAVRLDSRPDRAPGLLGARAAPRRARRSTRDGRGGAPPAHPRPRRLDHAHRPGARPRRRARDARPCGRDDRLGSRAAGRRGDRHRLRLVAVLLGQLGRLREAQRRRHRHDRHRRAGERHRVGDGSPDLRR